MKTLLTMDSVSFTYPKNREPVLSDINIEIHQSEYLAIVGTSGSGKSTLLSILGLINFPTSGDYKILDTSVTSLTANSVALLKNREIGLVFQNFNLLSHKTVFDNVALPLVFNSSIKRKHYRKYVLDALEAVGMASFHRRYPGELSGGQQQRVAIARSIVNSPSLLLADEPTGNLDSKNSQLVLDILEQLNQTGTTVCLITHDSNYTKSANRIITIADGRLCEV